MEHLQYCRGLHNANPMCSLCGVRNCVAITMLSIHLWNMREALDHS